MRSVTYFENTIELREDDTVKFTMPQTPKNEAVADAWENGGTLPIQARPCEY